MVLPVIVEEWNAQTQNFGEQFGLSRVGIGAVHDYADQPLGRYPVAGIDLVLAKDRPMFSHRFGCEHGKSWTDKNDKPARLPESIKPRLRAILMEKHQALVRYLCSSHEQIQIRSYRTVLA